MRLTRWLVLCAFLSACFNPVGNEDGGTGGGSGGNGGSGGSGGSGGTGGSGGSGGTGGTGGTGGSGGSGGTGGSGGSGGGGGAQCFGMPDGGAGCPMYRDCCAGRCVNTSNNPQHCGSCGNACSGPTPYCDGTCQAPPTCTAPDAGACPGGFCCQNTCCGAGQICCKSEGPVSGFSVCHTPTTAEPTCPAGCAPLCASDRNIKRDVRAVDAEALLQEVARLPIASWSYTYDDPSVRHIGPMAQDFKAAFQVGATDKAYDPVDAHGISFASIQALYRLVQEQNARLAALEAANKKLEAELKARPRR